MYQAVFQRYELKYMLTKEQKERILGLLEPYMRLDSYGRATIQNIYFDTEDYRLIRRSIEKPVYKEKLRMRSYGEQTSDRKVFVELKKKYQKVVYKRRLSMREEKAMQWLKRESACEMDSQIAKEIDYFLEYYENLKPVLYLAYEREAYKCKEDNDFRVTFDENIICRQEEMRFGTKADGISVLDEGMVLMEIKCSGGIPLWMTEILSKERIYKTSFSKYGTAYQKIIYPKWKGVQI